MDEPAVNGVRTAFLKALLVLVDPHEQGVVHRDLKPDNVYVVSTGVLPLFIKVLDFGLSRSEQIVARAKRASPSLREGRRLGAGEGEAA